MSERRRCSMAADKLMSGAGATGDTRPGMERLILHDRVILGLSLVVICALAWVYLARTAADMRAMAAEAEMHAAMGMTMPDMHSWNAADVFGLFLMWTVMMVGMMLPSAAPVVLIVVGVYRHRAARGARLLSVAFAAGYFAVWTVFSGAAAILQSVLHRTALLSPAMASQSAWFVAFILMATGIYQWLPLKSACLTECRSPLDFLTRSWREGTRGAFTMGARHGLVCVGCCWALMALLFVAGVMNLIWVAAVAVLVMVEKLVHFGPAAGKCVGVLLFAGGIWVAVSAHP